MPSKLSITVAGHAGQDAVRVTPEGKFPYYRFSVCVNESVKNKKFAHWISIWDRSKEEYSQAKFVKKGDSILVVDASPFARAYMKDGKAHAELCATTFRTYRLAKGSTDEHADNTGDPTESADGGNNNDLPF